MGFHGEKMNTKTDVKKRVDSMKKRFEHQSIISKGVLVTLLAMILLMSLSLLFDNTIFRLVFGLSNPVLDRVMEIASNHWFVLIVMYAAPALWLLQDKRRKYIPFLAGSVALSYAFSALLKLGIARVRPFIAMDLDPVTLARSFSFPSNHAAIAFAAIPIILLLFRRAKPFLLAAAILISLSRIYLGVHYLSDALAGAFIGLAVGYLLLYFKDETLNSYSLEVKRQTMHMMWGSLIILLLYLRFINIYAILIIILAGLLTSYVAMRQSFPLLKWFLKNFDRKERIPGWGAITLFIGILISILLFSNPITVTSSISLACISILAFGDSASTFFGRRFGKHKNPLNRKKTLEGSIAGMIFAFLGAIIFIDWYFALAASIIAMIFEAIEGRYLKISDNITVPLSAGVTIILLANILG